ncbi:MAG: PQQ-binding-like beta-propeller repeat protein, partial [Solirubrobacterales bacterium]
GKLFAATDSGVAAYSESTGALLWRKSSRNQVRALALAGSTLYVGGAFPEIDDQPRKHLAAFDANTGDLLPWSPDASNTVNSLVATPLGIFAGGFFEEVNGVPRGAVVQLDPETGAVGPWSPRLTGTSWGMAASGSTLLVAGGFTSIQSTEQKYLAALDPQTGWPLPWNPKVDGPIEALDSVGDTVYAGGRFSSVGGTPRGNGAAFSAQSGELLPWNPESDAGIDQLAANEQHVYVGSRFAELDAHTGQRTSWRPGIDWVSALALDGDSLFVADTYSLSGFDVAEHRRYDWNPTADSVIYSLAVDAKSIYVGGAFGSIGGGRRPVLAEFSRSTLGLRPTKLQAGDFAHIWRLAIDGGDLIAGGSIIDGDERRELVSINRSTGALGAWRPQIVGVLSQIAPTDNALWLGGNIGSNGNVPGYGLARYPDAPTSSDSYIPSDPPGPGLENPPTNSPAAPGTSPPTKALARAVLSKLRVLRGTSKGKTLRISVRSDRVVDVKINVRNKRGKQIVKFKRSLVAGTQILELKLASNGRPKLAAGTYSVSIAASKGPSLRVGFKVRATSHD